MADTLLAIAGLSPAVVSGTYFALRRQGSVIDRVIVAATAAGLRKARAALSGKDGALAQISALPLGGCASADPPQLSFAVIKGADGTLLNDVRCAADHAAVLQALDRLVRPLTQPGAPPLHASLAGGRKTMAAALALIMSMRARSCDRMSHVLSGAALETSAAALVPEPHKGPEHDVTLIDVPFVRLSALLDRKTLRLGVIELLPVVQSAVDRQGQTLPSPPAILALAAAPPSLSAWGRSLPLSPVLAALLAMLAEAGEAGISALTLETKAFDALHRIASSKGGPARIAALRLRREDAPGWLREHISRLRSALAKGWPVDPPVEIITTGRRPASRYRLKSTPPLHITRST